MTNRKLEDIVSDPKYKEVGLYSNAYTKDIKTMFTHPFYSGRMTFDAYSKRFKDLVFEQKIID